MGVNFYGYSNIIMKPIPNKYKAKKIKQQIPDLSFMNNKYVDSYKKMNGIGYDHINKREIICDKIIKSKHAEKWYQEMFEDGICIHIDWQNDRYYMRSDETTGYECTRSYTGYNDFVTVCNNHLQNKNLSKLRYILPSTDCPPENGFTNDIEKLKILIEDLQNIDEEMMCDTTHNWFYVDYCNMLKLALECGGILIY